MRKSSSNLNSKPPSRRRASSMPKINLDEFSSHSQQLSLLSEELSTLKKEKEALNDYNVELQKSINESQAENQKIIEDHDRLHAETLKLKRNLKKTGQILIKNKNVLKDFIESVQKLDLEIEGMRKQKEDLERIRKKENMNVGRLTEVVTKMRIELGLQEREREKLRNEVVCSLKQIKQLEEKVENLRITNLNFTRKIKISINK
jgi:chromosome segregation ATPase